MAHACRVGQLQWSTYLELAALCTRTMTTETEWYQDDVQDLDVWCFYYQPALDDPTTVSAYESWLSPIDLQRYRAFVFEKDRLAFLASRALVRSVLSFYAPQPPEAWRFVLGANGKPRLDTVPPCGPLHFNLSNTQGLVVCGISRHTERLGVDVESFARSGSLDDIAGNHFADTEVAALCAQPDADKLEAFLRLWTLKESFIKATGKGLSTPLNQFAFTLAPGHPTVVDNVTVSFTEHLAERTEHWRFIQWRMPGHYIVSLGVDTGGRSLRYRLLRAAPLLPGHGAPLVVQ